MRLVACVGRRSVCVLLSHLDCQSMTLEDIETSLQEKEIRTMAGYGGGWSTVRTPSARWDGPPQQPRYEPCGDGRASVFVAGFDLIIWQHGYMTKVAI